MKPIEITYDFLFKKKGDGFEHIYSVKDINVLNPIYGKELYIPTQLTNGRDYLFQALGNLGVYGNNQFDTAIHYFLLPDSTVDKLQFGIKDDVIKFIEQICEEQRNKSKDPKKWRFNITFVLENEIVEYVTTRSNRIEDILTLNLIAKYGKY